MRQIGSLLDGAAEKVTQFHKFDLGSIRISKFVQRAVQIEQLGTIDIDPGQILSLIHI